MWVKHIFRKNYKKLLILAVVVVVMLVVLKHYNEVEVGGTDVLKVSHTQSAEEDKNLFVKSAHLSCPLCFGDDLCEDIKAGFMVIQEQIFDRTYDKPKRDLRAASMGSLDKLISKMVHEEEMDHLEKEVCRGVQSSICSIETVRHEILSRAKDLVSVRNIQNIYQVAGKNRSELPFTMCATPRFVSTLELAFDDNNNQNIEAEEKTHLYTSLVTCPEVAIIKFLTYASMNLAFPHWVGACGRGYVVSGDLTPLVEFINEPFEVRAGLASQILSLVDDMRTDDPDWFMMMTDLSYENFAVDHDGEVTILDVSNMAVLDKSLVEGEEHTADADNDKVGCNKECFKRFTHDVYYSPTTEDVCVQFGDHAQLMYAIVCEQILSDLNEHKVANYFSNNNSHRKHRGLLHSLPEKEAKEIEGLLRECVVETARGMRDQAGEELRDILSDFTVDEDDDDFDDDDDAEDQAGEDYTDDDGKVQQHHRNAIHNKAVQKRYHHHKNVHQQ